MAERSSLDRRRRADRILDSARDLLLRWGYRRVTIDEVAARAGVGKGTIYLHWRSREDIFHAVSAREAAAMTQAIVDAVRQDPAEVALHRYLRRLFVEAMERPVLRALYTRDADTLDKFLAAVDHQRLEEAKLGVNRDYLGVLAAEGLLRSGLRPDDLDYTLPTIVFGFFAAEPFLPAAIELSLQQKADQLADTVRRAFELPTAPAKDALKRAAAKAIPILGRLADDFLAATYGGDHHE
ncbi:TetR/AcrR family transcriptional regulator [Mycobacterium colombiense]|uniref:TetR family transcriptional regulator n=1 Tax=Mycobacterium colombiense CECT 3035 TaxID=1041522 RepID=J5EEK5_9MYCO|nr:TetR/AcrR family transcriptional regulator [Mycobacterium colombiense]EJO89886.1 TetR family transcriptional regulator [Mycobacterium colombiense CECT 3035]